MSMECEKKKAPIGVFDSGVGGLTVVREITRQLPHENIVYFGDTARVPYGSKSKSNIIRFSEQIIRFLKTKQVKAIVIACNTASALALDTVRDEFDIPIIGVIVPGARAAVEATANGEIGVVGTDATVKSGTYTKVIHQMDPNIHVREKACPLFVPLVEEGFKEHVVTEEVIEYYLESLKHTEIDAMILGCTHYPLLRSKIRAYMGERIQIVNPAYETAMDLKRLLQSEDMENDGEEGTSSKYEFYVSDAAEKFVNFANTVMPFDISKANIVNIRGTQMTKDVLVSISGLHMDMDAQIPGPDEDDVIEVVTPATYYSKNGKHYIIYDEIVEGVSDTIKNKIKISGTDSLEIMKSGLSNTHMIFEKNKKNLTYYKTPYGQMLVGLNTRNMEIEVLDETIKVRVDYELDVNHEPLANCKIRMNIVSKGSRIAV